MHLYAITIFLSSFLLFQVQPLIGRSILPWFGGSAAVWTTCMLFFQTFLLGGYLYAYLSVQHLSPRRQIICHNFLLAAALLFLPIVPSPALKPNGGEIPVVAILGVLTATVGIPYLLLSATSPLLQAWYARTHEKGMPYRLFALSNAASLLALLTYPTLVEPRLPLRVQAICWSVTFALFAAACSFTAWRSRSKTTAPPAVLPPADRIGVIPAILWVLLSAAPSALLLSVTNHITQNVAAIPFLWIVPLVLYLLSFVVCFEKETWYRRTIWFPAAAIGVAAMIWSLGSGSGVPKIRLLLPLFSMALFACCMLCHGELVRLKPHPSRLTAFYLLSSLGGGIGGIFVGVISPLIFQTYFELKVSLATTMILALLSFLVTPPAVSPLARKALVAVVAAVACAPFAYFINAPSETDDRRHVRNFYGVLSVLEKEEEGARVLVHGVIQHGKQFLSKELRSTPTTYYGNGTGIGLAMQALSKKSTIDVAVVGLGVGTLASYGRKGDRITFYEINPLVLDLARRDFTYLSDSPAQVNVVLGDARLSLERANGRQFDLLAVDAFSGDSIPVHLLTREALELYFRRLKPEGVLAIHISNQYLDLEPVLAEGLKSLGKDAVLVDSKGDEDEVVYSATWILASADRGRLPGEGRKMVAAGDFPCWTDDYSNVFRIMK